MTEFSTLGLSAPLLKALTAEGYTTPTPIQARAIPELLQGRDLLGIAQTGTGKTAAFALPILELLSSDQTRVARGTCKALILSPTRELASQIHDSFKTYGRNVRVSSAVVFGGVSIGKQIERVRNGCDVVIATPGRLIDLIDRRALNLSSVKTFVLDEVDQMLDLGFIHAIRRIVTLLPDKRQNLFFSATMPKEISGLASGLLHNPVRIEIAPVATTAERVKQSVIHVEPAAKPALLVALMAEGKMFRTLIFSRTKHGADKVAKVLEKAGHQVAVIHGNKSQSNRERALAGFKSGVLNALVATDIAARGIDVDGVSHVINYDLPHVPESYVHRIGRTARAGADGEAIAFCTPEERGLLRDIERTTRQAVPVQDHDLGLKNVKELAPSHGWNPAGKGRGSRFGGKPHGGRPSAPRGGAEGRPSRPGRDRDHSVSPRDGAPRDASSHGAPRDAVPSHSAHAHAPHAHSAGRDGAARERNPSSGEAASKGYNRERAPGGFGYKGPKRDRSEAPRGAGPHGSSTHGPSTYGPARDGAPREHGPARDGAPRARGPARDGAPRERSEGGLKKSFGGFKRKPSGQKPGGWSKPSTQARAT